MRWSDICCSVPHLSIFHVHCCIPSIWSWLAKVGNEQLLLHFLIFGLGNIVKDI